MRASHSLATRDELTLSSSALARSRVRLFWLGILVLPLAILLALGIFPALNLHFVNQWFHFQIVSFASLVAFVLGITTIVLLEGVNDARAFFIPIGLGAISGVFMIHGLSTPGVLEISPMERAVSVSIFPRPDLAVAWSTLGSLLAGSVFFAAAGWRWSGRGTEWLMAHRRALLIAFTILYLGYVCVAFFFPTPLVWLDELAPVSRIFFGALTGVLYLGAAWNFFSSYRRTGRQLDAALAIASILLCEALLPLLLMPLWSIGWWSYHIWMLLAFGLALGAVIWEYERARHFQLTTYFAAASAIATALLALVAGELSSRTFTGIVPENTVNNLRWSATFIFVLMAALLFGALWFVVRRGDTLLRANSRILQEQHAALERGRLAETLVPIGVAMGESLDLQRVLDLICRESQHLFQVETTLLWLKQDNELLVCAAHGEHREAFLNMRQPIANNNLLGARVVREQHAMYVNYALTSRKVNAEIANQYGIQSIMGVPLISQGEVLGSLVLLDLQNAERFGRLDVDVAQLFAQQAAQAMTHARLYEKIHQQTHALQSALGDLRTSYNQTLAALSAALDARDHETEGHSRRVTAYALLLADTLNIRDTQARQAIEWGALLHDVGKIGVPDAILHKPGALSNEEWVLMRQHPEIGYQILQSIPFLEPAFAIVRYHHERWDGKGYPLKLLSTDIPLAARIFSIADTLDAMTTDRPYRKALPFQAAYREITTLRGAQFDPQVVDAFVKLSQQDWRAAAQL